MPVLAIPVPALPIPAANAPGGDGGGGVSPYPVAPQPSGAARQPPASPTNDGRAMARLNLPEREYVRSLKRRERSALVKLLVDAKRPRVAMEPPLRIRVLQSHLPEAVRRGIFEDLKSGCNDKYVQWVRRAVELPLGVETRSPWTSLPFPRAIAHARQTLDAAITGHSLAKGEILKLVCQNHLGGGGAAYSLGIEGPPGTGKTHMVRHAIAPALGRPLVSIPLGGATDISYLLGSIYTYEGSREGRLATALVESGCCNPIIHLDEVDKISASDRGAEIAAVLIHLVDPSANFSLRDRYFHGIDLDFSKCTFVFTYNDASKVNPILLDRIKRICLHAPTDEERLAIARTHLAPRAQKRLRTDLALSEEALAYLSARGGAKGGATAGMRGVEQEVDHVLATAQLRAACEEEDGEVQEEHDDDPLPRTLRDAQGRVTKAFAEACVGMLDRAASGTLGPPPPLGMYS